MTTRVVTFKLSEELLEKLDEIARREGKTRSEVIRAAIEMFIVTKLRGPRIARTVKIRLY